MEKVNGWIACYLFDYSDKYAAVRGINLAGEVKVVLYLCFWQMNAATEPSSRIDSISSK